MYTLQVITIFLYLVQTQKLHPEMFVNVNVKMNLYSATSRKASQLCSVHQYLVHDRLQCAPKDTAAYSRLTQFHRQWIPDGRTLDREGPPTIVLRRYRGMIKWCRLADRRCRLAVQFDVKRL